MFLLPLLHSRIVSTIIWLSCWSLIHLGFVEIGYQQARLSTSCYSTHRTRHCQDTRIKMTKSHQWYPVSHSAEWAHAHNQKPDIYMMITMLLLVSDYLTTSKLATCEWGERLIAIVLWSLNMNMVWWIMDGTYQFSFTRTDMTCAIIAESWIRSASLCWSCVCVKHCYWFAITLHWKNHHIVSVWNTTCYDE